MFAVSRSSRRCPLIVRHTASFFESPPEEERVVHRSYQYRPEYCWKSARPRSAPDKRSVLHCSVQELGRNVRSRRGVTHSSANLAFECFKFCFARFFGFVQDFTSVSIRIYPKTLVVFWTQQSANKKKVTKCFKSPKCWKTQTCSKAYVIVRIKIL